jgi:hypothetical protein
MGRRTRYAIGFLLTQLAISPVLAQKDKGPPTLIEQMRPAITYEDCETRCKECGSGRNPECVKNFCTGYPRRKPGAAPLPVVCPGYGGWKKLELAARASSMF